MSLYALNTDHHKIDTSQIQGERLLEKRVAVLMGGKSAERQVSLRSGKRVLAALQRQGVSAIPIDPIDEDWLEEMRRASIDIAFLALHGKGCEDGTIQGVLEAFGFPYTGSGVLASALAMDKVMAKRVLSTTGVPTPNYFVVDVEGEMDSQCEEAVDRLGFPIVVKPTSEGSSIGVSIVREMSEFKRIARKTHREFGDLFFEQYIQGKEVTVGLLGVKDTLRALPVLELVPKREFYDYEAKYTEGMTEFVLPANLSGRMTETVQQIAVHTHKIIGCWGFSRVDMRIDLAGNPYVMEVNTLPGLTDLSDLPAQAAAAGIVYDELILEILSTALIRHRACHENPSTLHPTVD